MTMMMYNFLGREPFQVLYLEYSDDVDAPAQVLSKELVVRRVVLDPRRRSGHISIAVFIMEAKGKKLNGKHFTGCQVGHFFSNEFHFRTPLNYK